MYGLDPEQFVKRILRPTIEYVGLYSPSACVLVLGTAMQESKLEYVLQIKGPAVGLYQMEKPTYDDIYANFLNNEPELKVKVDDLAIQKPDFEEMAGNLYFATAMCRVHYRRFKEPLPEANNALGMSNYWKKYYNTFKGAGIATEAMMHFKKAYEYA